MVTVRIPSAMRALTGGAGTVEVEAATVGGALGALTEVHPAVAGRLFDDQGRPRRFINVFVDEEDIRFASGLDTAVAEGQTISLLPAVSGG